MGEIEKGDGDQNGDSLYFEDDDKALEFESDADESENESEVAGNNELYDDALYGAKRPRLEDESIKLTEEQQKVVANLKKMNKKFVHLFYFIFIFIIKGSILHLPVLKLRSK